VTGGDEQPSSWERWYSLATTFVAPATFLSALLFYFGYVSSRAELAYFGVDVDTVGLSTRDYVMRSPAALLVPALLLTTLGATALLASRLADERLSPTGERWLRSGSVVAVATGVVLVVTYRWAGGWAAYPMVTPLLLAVGIAVLAWLWHRTGTRRGPVAFAVLTVVVCLFWATATLAQWTGLGAAQRTARNLDELPAVVLDTKERLYYQPVGGAVEEAELPAEEDQSFRYRYRGLRLLIQAGDRMFLVPERWSAAGSTLVVELSDVRAWFRFVNQRP
jgi:hypothetical protein